MKQIQAIIQPFMANHVLDSLHRIEGVAGVMASEVRCTSAARGNHNPDINTRIELIVPDELVETVLAAIQTHSHTGRRGDGSIFVLDVQSTVRIASGERDDT